MSWMLPRMFQPACLALHSLNPEKDPEASGNVCASQGMLQVYHPQQDMSVHPVQQDPTKQKSIARRVSFAPQESSPAPPQHPLQTPAKSALQVSIPPYPAPPSAYFARNLPGKILPKPMPQQENALPVLPIRATASLQVPAFLTACATPGSGGQRDP